MCEGEIIAKIPISREIKGKNNFHLLLGYLYRITDSVYDSNPYKVNMCGNCGDLKIKGLWQKIPYSQRSSISDAVQSKSIKIDGCLVICDFCASTEREIKEKSKNLYKDPIVSGIDFDCQQISSIYEIF